MSVECCVTVWSKVQCPVRVVCECGVLCVGVICCEEYCGVCRMLCCASEDLTVVAPSPPSAPFLSFSPLPLCPSPSPPLSL